MVVLRSLAAVCFDRRWLFDRDGSITWRLRGWEVSHRSYSFSFFSLFKIVKQRPLSTFITINRLYLSLYTPLYSGKGLKVNSMICVKMIVHCIVFFIVFTKFILCKFRDMYTYLVYINVAKWLYHSHFWQHFILHSTKHFNTIY